MLDIHPQIKEKLEYFKSTHKIPNLLFHGASGSGKRTLLYDFINDLYGNEKERIKAMCMFVNCAHGKGIKFVREELKFFAKTHINSNGGAVFKSIILLNSDKLTMDAQSALRRCIELFSHNTRFFMVVENKYNLLKPILSRFCEIYVPEPLHRGKPINLYVYNLNQIYKPKKDAGLESEINNYFSKGQDIMSFCEQLYNKGYSGIDLIKLIEDGKFQVERRNELLIACGRIRKEFRNEKLILLFILQFLHSEESLENMSFI
jgi:DNA polymerase III delta prime subunit